MEKSSDFRFENVWKSTSPEIREAAAKFWLDMNAFRSYDKIEERTSQLVYLVRGPDSKIIGESTVFKANISSLHNHFYSVRLMLDPAFRIPGLLSKLLVLTRDHLELVYKEDDDPGCKGVIVLVENEEIKKRRREAVWPASGMMYIGKTPKGNHIRLYYFKDVEI